jgi:hypothetical protein
MKVKIGDLELPLAPVRDLIALADEAFAFERSQLLADIEAAGLDPEARLERLRDLSMRKGTASLLIMATFRLEFAMKVVRARLQEAVPFAPGLDPELILFRMRHEEMVSAAQAFLGYRERDPEDPRKAAANP